MKLALKIHTDYIYLLFLFALRMKERKIESKYVHLHFACIVKVKFRLSGKEMDKDNRIEGAKENTTFRNIWL